MHPLFNPLAELRQQYLDQLPVRLDALRFHYQQLSLSAWQPAQAEALHRLLHGLTGSAGTFGLQSLSDAARQLEIRLAALIQAGTAPDEAPWQAIDSGLERLDRLARMRLRSDAPNLTPPAEVPRFTRSPLIHLVEDDPTQAEHLSRILRDDGYRVQVFTTPSDFRAAYAVTDAERPAAVVVDMVFPEGDAAGAELMAEFIAGQARCPPVVFVSVRDDLAARLAAYRAGACRYMVKPVDPARLISLLNALSGRQPQQPYRVLLVDDDPLMLEAHAAVLRATGMVVHTLSQPLQIMDALNRLTPDVLVLDVYMPEASGPELAAVLREHDEHLHLPILFLSAESDMAQQLLALNLGGDDFLVKPVQPDHLVSAVTARARRARQNAAIRQRLQTTLYEREREHLALDHHAIVSVADATGRITYVNDKFCDISGYTRGELLGHDHRIVKSGEHPPEFFQNLWHTITSGMVWQGETCNRRKDGSLYWVESTITPFLDGEGIPYQYVSMRTDITHMKSAEAALRASEARLSFLVSSSPVTIFTSAATPPFDASYISPNVKKFMGFEPEQFTDNPAFWADNIHPDDRQRVLDALPQLFEHGKHQHEYRFRMNDGSYRWMHDELLLVRDESGKPSEIIGYWMDITERKRIEHAAESHKERLRRGQLFANIGTWDWNIQTGELFWTERIAPLFGYPVGELETSYDNFLAAIHPDDRQAVIDAVAACIERDRPYELEHRVVWPDGTVRWLLERGAVAYDADGKPLQMLGVVQDIDDRKRAEMALAERERQLREAQTLACIGNWSADLSSGTLTWSDEIYRIFGYAPGSFAPSVDAFRAAVHPDDLALVRESEKRAEQTGRHDVVHRIVRPDGTVRHVHELAQMEADAAGRPVFLTGTVQDVTAQVEIEQAMVAARDEADRANQAKSDFLSSMSHELRTPMNAVLGFGQLMEYDNTLPAEHLDSVREILKAGHHLLELINEVLDLVKVESGQIDLSLEPVEVCPVVAECLDLVGPLAAKRGIQVSQIGLAGAMLRADRTRLKQALLNLLGNAIKYNREGGSVLLDVQTEGDDRLRIRVTDTGPGIPAARLNELFQPFNRLGAENSNTEGTGIGLTITRRIVEMMGGSVDVRSEVGVGSTFWIELPLESAPNPELGQPQREPDEGTPDGAPERHLQMPQQTVLYIEDNPSNIKLVAQILGRRKHIQLLTAHTPELGIELALGHHPELILLDISMPGMDGYQVLEIFKADARLKAIPVVAVTANAMTRDIERGLAAGFNDYLTKPLDVARFHAMVDACLALTGKNNA
ncbi:PAS domain-containing protein [Rhodoferax sp.]|uniref:PAS domain-containing protein n=1 Tax=Rhodoferax sp. TaxID=50421 RepID=UPI00272F167B|nr:PAS domain-containing protein [Rhodoferax sp.]MDP2441399.1 PAS domain-containing protein [Rhodoferax sp.]MDZ4207261.1 PAS domain-containing protein [Rhodoferax sp.]